MASPALNPTETTDGQATTAVHAAIEAIAVTMRDDFLLELGQALGGKASINPVDTVIQGTEQLDRAKNTQILLLDSRGLPDLQADVAAVESQFPQIPVLVFAESNAEQEVAATVKGSRVFAVLPIPLDPDKTAAVVSGAVDAAQAAPPPPAVSTIDTIETELAPPIARQPIRPEPRDVSAGREGVDLRLVGGVALALLAVIVLWISTRDKAPRPAMSPVASKPAAVVAQAPVTAETSLVSGKVDALLEKARTAMRERRYIEPSGDNALLFYRSAARTDPANAEALDGLTRVASVVATRFEEALSKSDAQEAALMFEQFKSAVPKDMRIADFQFRLTKLRAELEEARKKRLAEAQAAREAAAIEQKRAREARLAAAEMERKAELARVKKEAQDSVNMAQSVSSSSAASTPVQSPPEPRTLASLQSSLQRKRYVEPEYPRDALERNIGGVVTVAFTVDIKGLTRDIRIESAEPAGVFERATIDAVRRWRYEPLLVDGVPTEVPSRTSIRFAPP